jgi:hypothetical protein
MTPVVTYEKTRIFSCSSQEHEKDDYRNKRKFPALSTKASLIRKPLCSATRDGIKGVDFLLALSTCAFSANVRAIAVRD